MQELVASDGMGANMRSGKARVGHSKEVSLPVAGTRLVREWNGRRYEVTVASNGFEHGGKLYRSLSAVAKAITGTHWNGRLFFGVAKSPASRGKAEQ